MTIPLLKSQPTQLNFTVAQLILTCQVKTSKALMKIPIKKMRPTETYHLAQLGSMSTNLSLLTEQMQPTNQLLHQQFILQAVMDQD